MQLPCSYPTKTNTPCQAPALKGSDPPGCISHDPRPSVRSLKRAAVRKGGQKVWANQKAKVHETMSRSERMQPLLDAIDKMDLPEGEKAVLKASVDDYVRSSKVSDSTKALNLVGMVLGMLTARKERAIEPPSDEDLSRRLTRAVQSVGLLRVCGGCGKETKHRHDFVCSVCDHVTCGSAN